MILKRMIGAVTALTLTAVPVLGGGITANAEPASTAWTKTQANTTLGVSAINAPSSTPLTTPDETSGSTWNGNYVYYGKYNSNPVKYRVLDPETTIFGGKTLFLDCDSILFNKAFDIGSPYWATSDIRQWLNDVNADGTEANTTNFLKNDNFFTTSERASIANSTKASAAESDGNGMEYLSFAKLSNDKIFLLDAKEATNTMYGYHNNENYNLTLKKRLNDSSFDCWWLRSNYKSVSAGCVTVRTNSIDSDLVNNADGGVSPAFNVELSKILFSTEITSGVEGDYGHEYKLTLKDTSMTAAQTTGEQAVYSGKTVDIPYTLTGNADQVSVLITDKAYNADGAKIKYYGKLSDVTSSSLSGYGAFDLPDDLSIDSWGSSYYVYLLAENANTDNPETDVDESLFTDYASTPVELTTAPTAGHSVTLSNCEHGSVSAVRKCALKDKIIALTATPESGYHFKSIKVTDKDGAAVVLTKDPVDETKYTFTMPDKNVTVTAEFVRNSSAPAYETYEQNGIVYHIWDDHAELAECDTAAKTVTIPTEFKGLPVTEIGENAFNSCKNLTEVIIPESVTTIGQSAFWGCTSLESVTMPESVTEIGKDIFKKCSALKEVKGYKGSQAEKYAKDKEIEFVPVGEPAVTATTTEAVTTTTTTTTTVSTTTSNTTTAETTTVTTTTQPKKPSAPTNITVSENGTVTWTASDNATDYKVFKKYGDDTYHSGWIKDTSYTFSGVPTVDYEVYVAAKNDYGTAWSEHITVKVKDPLGKVTKAAVSNGTVSWKSQQGAVAYKVAKIVNGKTYYGKKITDTTYTFKNMPKTDYKIFVVAFDKNGKRTWGRKISVSAE